MRCDVNVYIYVLIQYDFWQFAHDIFVFLKYAGYFQPAVLIRNLYQRVC